MNRTATRRWLTGLAGLSCTALVLTGCSAGAGAGNDGSAFHVLALAPLSGPLSSLGSLQVAGLEAAADIINDKGGIDGRTVVVDAEDNAGDAATGVERLQTYLTDDGRPDMLMPGLTSQEVMAVLPLATANQILTVHVGGATDANDPEKFPYAFGSGTTFMEVNERVIEHFRAEGYHKIAYIGADTTSARLSLAAMEKAGSEHGISVVSELVAPTSVDVTPTMLKLAAQQPDALFLAGAGPITGVYLSSARTAGWDKPIFGSSETCATDFATIAQPEQWADVQLHCYAFAVEGQPSAQSDTFAAFRQALGNHTDQPIGVSLVTPGFTYNDLILAWGAYEASESNEAADLADALESGRVPAEIREKYIGPVDWDFTTDDHTMTWGADELVFVHAGPTVDGMLVPDAD